MHLTEDHFCQLFLRSVGRLHPGKHVLDEVDQPEFIKEFVDPILEGEERPHWRELLIEHFAKRRVAILANAFDFICARDFFKIWGFLFG